ncbi:MAG: hypothetical protein JW863_23355 [Chitinispirillaceae bacterium]|nr:hypothetical protein [Chitinispirillaceae bacterium]
MRQVFLWVSLFLSTVYADIAVTPDARKDLQVTVYRDFAVVKDIRKINIPEGANRIRFEGVATGIDPETVNLDWKSGVEIELISQSYEFDLVSPTKLMEKYVGKEIEIVPSKEQWPDTAVKTAELISINGKEPVFRIGTQITFGDIGRILFPYMPDNLYTKPTLLWNVLIPKRQETEIVATYLTEGISWRVGYLLQVDKKGESGSFGGWITFNNQSGLDCKNSQVTFVAGDVKRISGRSSNELAAGARHGFQENGDYYFYGMNQRVTLFSNHSNQVEWIPPVQVKLKPGFFAQLDADDVEGLDNPTVYAAVEVENVASNSLGIPLPEGILRVFKRDSNDDTRFIGENLLDDTKTSQQFFATIGKTDGITITRKKAGKGSPNQIEIRNGKDKTISLRLLLDSRGRKVRESSRKYRIVRGTSLEWQMMIKSKEVFKITYLLDS